MRQEIVIHPGYVDPFHGGVWCEVERGNLTSGYPVYSRVFYCPACRQLWGELLNSPMDPAFAVTVSCYRCNWTEKGRGVYADNCGDLGRGMVPGSILDYNTTIDGIDWDLLDSLPEELLRREFHLTLKAF